MQWHFWSMPKLVYPLLSFCNFCLFLFVFVPFFTARIKCVIPKSCPSWRTPLEQCKLNVTERCDLWPRVWESYDRVAAAGLSWEKCSAILRPILPPPALYLCRKPLLFKQVVSTQNWNACHFFRKLNFTFKSLPPWPPLPLQALMSKLRNSIKTFVEHTQSSRCTVQIRSSKKRGFSNRLLFICCRISFVCFIISTTNIETFCILINF